VFVVGIVGIKLMSRICSTLFGRT